MKRSHTGLIAAAAIVGTLVTTLAWAHHGGRHFHHHNHARVGVYVGAPLLWSPWWYAPYPYYPQTVVVRPAAPVVYVEQADAAAAPSGAAMLAPAPQAEAPQQFWHYCADSKTYYPYVSTCASPWQRVIPHTPPPPPG